MSAYLLTFDTFMMEVRKWGQTNSLYKIKREDRGDFFIFSITLPNGEEYISSIRKADFNVFFEKDLENITIEGKRIDENIGSTKLIISKLEELKDVTKPTISNTREII